MKKFIKWFGILSLALIFVILASLTLFLGWMKWSGERDWKRVQAELRVKGEPLTFAELVPPPPPDSENFFADPMWRQLHDLTPHKEQGATTWGPDKIPDEKLLINQWNTPLTSEERERVSNLLHIKNDHNDRRNFSKKSAPCSRSFTEIHSSAV